jgi:hypothetical protein
VRFGTYRQPHGRLISPGVAGPLSAGSLAIRTNIPIAAQRNLLFKMQHQPADLFAVYRFAVYRRA